METLRTRMEEHVCFIQLYRPGHGNAITAQMLKECVAVLDACEQSVSVLVIEGLPDEFCIGADLTATARAADEGTSGLPEAARLYEFWQRLSSGPFISIAHVEGKATAGGVGLAAACDVVLASEKATFSCSELLFGLFPACVLPFLARRVGRQRAHYMAITTQSIDARQACAWGLVDACAADSDIVLRKHLLRLRRLPKRGLARYKEYAAMLDSSVADAKDDAVFANQQMFSDPHVRQNITRYVRHGLLPWED